MSSPNPAEPDYAVLYASNTNPPVPYYLRDIRFQVSPEFKNRLAHDAGIPVDRVAEHCQDIRDKAWAIRAYPCVGFGFYFQPPLLLISPAYPLLLQKMKEPRQRYLDIGCFLGIDMRFLFHDLSGGEEVAEKFVGCDIVDFWDLGCELFRDKGGAFDRGARFVRADFMDRGNGGMKELQGACDVVNISAVLHQFGGQAQMDACKRLIEFAKKDKGSIVMGNQLEFKTKGEKTIAKTTAVYHNEESWKEFWDEVSEKTGTKWEAHAESKSWEQCGYDPKLPAYWGPDAGMLFWYSVRLQ